MQYSLTATADGTTLTMVTDAPDKATRDAIAESGMESGL